MSSCDNKDDAQRALDDARRLAAQGDYAGALAKHVWFHDNALSIRPSFYGVRLSFALSDWIQLGEKYPKAFKTLKSIRDTKVSMLHIAPGNRELFHDVVAINEHLSESAATVELFKRIEASDPNFATSLYDLAERALLEAREFDLARKHLGNPSDRLTSAQLHFDQGMQFAKTTKNSEAARRSFETIFTGEAVGVITVLNETGDRDGAKTIQAEALKTLNNEMIRSALPQ